MIATWYGTEGRITGSKASSDIIDMSMSRGDGERLFPGIYDGKEYYINTDPVIPSPTMRSENPTTISDQTISNIPNPSEVDCGKLGSYIVTDGEFDFTIDTPGTYTLTVRSVPHFDKIFEVVIP